MSNKTRLQTNNTNLQSLIDKANALPEAGSGGGSASVDTCRVTIISNGVGGALFNSFYYTCYSNSELTSQMSYYRTDNTTARDEVVKGSIIAFTGATNLISITCNGGSVLYCKADHCAVFINQDAPDEIIITLSNQ